MQKMILRKGHRLRPGGAYPKTTITIRYVVKRKHCGEESNGGKSRGKVCRRRNRLTIKQILNIGSNYIMYSCSFF